MIADFFLCFVVQQTTKYLFANLEPPELVIRGRERRDKRRADETLALLVKAKETANQAAEAVVGATKQTAQAVQEKLPNGK